MTHNASIDNESNSVAVLDIEAASSWAFMEPFSITLNKTPVLGIGAKRSLIHLCHSLHDECRHPNGWCGADWEYGRVGLIAWEFFEWDTWQHSIAELVDLSSNSCKHCCIPKSTRLGAVFNAWNSNREYFTY